jgi:hypothetical protein
MNVLANYFLAVLADTGARGPIGEILSLLSQGTLDRGTFREIINRHGVRRELWFRKQRLDLVLGLLAALINNSGITEEDLASIAQLKQCLEIAEGEFISLRPAEVATVLTGELAEILEDDGIDEHEDLYQLGLQEVFGLSYDQYLQLTRAEFERGMASLLERLESARCSRDRLRARELEAKIAALDPLYRLAIAQPRSLGALY